MTRLQLWAVASVTASLMLGLGFIAPVLPRLATELQVGPTQLGVLMAAFPLGRLTFLYVSGVAADRFAFRSLGMVASAFSGLSALVAGLLFTAWWLVVLLGCMGIGSALYTASASTHVLESSADERLGRNLGVYQTFVLAGVSLGPLLGAVVAERVGLQWPFFVYAFLCACGFVATSQRGLVGEEATVPSLGTASAASTSSSAAPGDRSSRLLAYALIGFAVLALFWVRTGHVNTLTPIFAFDELDMDVESIGYALTGTLLTTMLLVRHAGRVADRWPARTVLAAGGAALASCVLLLGQVRSAVQLFVVLLAFGGVTAYLLVTPQVFLARVTPPGRRGRAIGAHRSASAVGMVLGPMTVGPLLERLDAEWSFVFGAVGMAVASLLLLLLPPEGIRSHGPLVTSEPSQGEARAWPLRGR